MPDNQVIIPNDPAPTVIVNADGATVTVPGATVTQLAQPVDQGTSVSVANLGPQGATGISLFQTVHTYVIGGLIDTVTLIPPMFFYKRATQASTLKKISHKIGSGTSATLKLQQNGIDMVGYVGVVATTTRQTTAADIVLADADAISLVITAISATPKDLTVTLVIEHNIG